MPTNEVARQRARTLVQTEMARQGLTFAALAAKAEIDPGTLGKFLDGTYEGAYEASLIAEFEKLLPETPPWQKLEKVEYED